MVSVVTGAQGFLGRSLSAALEARGPVVRIDDHSRSGLQRTSSSIDLDVRDPKLQSFLSDAHTVWHLAAINGTQRFYQIPAEVLSVQIEGTANLLRACAASNVRRLILFSSSEVYQTPAQIPTPEEVPLTVPDISNARYSYAVSKIAAEAMSWHSSLQQVVILRPHNVYGPDMGLDHVIPQLIHRIVSLPPGSQALRVNSPAEATRSFVYIDDFIDAALLVADSLPEEGRVREIYHVGSNEELRIDNLALEIARLMNRSIIIDRGSAPDGSPLRRCPDSSKLAGLGWKARTSLDKGLEKSISAMQRINPIEASRECASEAVE